MIKAFDLEVDRSKNFGVSGDGAGSNIMVLMSRGRYDGRCSWGRLSQCVILIQCSSLLDMTLRPSDQTVSDPGCGPSLLNTRAACNKISVIHNLIMEERTKKTSVTKTWQARRYVCSFLKCAHLGV